MDGCVGVCGGARRGASSGRCRERFCERECDDSGDVERQELRLGRYKCVGEK